MVTFTIAISDQCRRKRKNDRFRASDDSKRWDRETIRILHSFSWFMRYEHARREYDSSHQDIIMIIADIPMRARIYTEQPFREFLGNGVYIYEKKEVGQADSPGQYSPQ